MPAFAIRSKWNNFHDALVVCLHDEIYQNRFYSERKEFASRVQIHSFCFILFYSITLEGRLIRNPFPFCPVFSCPSSAGKVHACPLFDIVFPPLLLFPFTVPCRIVFANPEDLETWPNHLSFRFLTRVRSFLYSTMTAWIFLRTSLLVTWSLYEMFNSLLEHLI